MLYGQVLITLAMPQTGKRLRQILWLLLKGVI